jgi:hypothetical protein
VATTCSFHSVPLYHIFKAKFVGKDAEKERLGPRSYEICSASHTEEENGGFKAAKIFEVAQ